MSDVINLITMAVSFASNTFTSVMNATGAYGFWLSAILVTFSFRAILKPIFGSVGSDLAKKSYNAFRRKNKED